jgi:thymidylate synthase
MNNLDKEYQMLLEYILRNGVVKKDRTGTGTLSVFGWQIRHKMSDGFPLLTTKQIHFKSVVTELLWFLRGDTNIKYLVDNGCHIWNGDAYKNYEKSIIQSHKENGLEGFEYLNKESFIKRIEIDDEFTKKWGELGSIYGKQWRSWSRKTTREEKIINPSVYEVQIDQIQNLINDLKTNPDSRRLMVNAWNVGELDQMVLPPCHYGFQIYTRKLSVIERMEIYFKKHPDWAIIGEHSFFDKHNIPTRAISLMWNQRSVDTFLGLPFNIASYGLLLMMIADEVGMVPDELIGNLGDVHLYSNHIEQAREQISREPFDLPTVHVRDGIESFMTGDIILENYQSHPSIKAPLSN